jgi:hypothetical protein
VFCTFFYSGNALIDMLAFYHRLEERQKRLRNEIRRDKQSIRSHLNYWKRFSRPEIYEQLGMEVTEILDSLDLIRHPADDSVRQYRRCVGIQRQETRLSQQSFWNTLIGWTVRHLIKQVTEKEAIQAVTNLLNKTWPNIHDTSFDSVKARYYRTI